MPMSKAVLVAVFLAFAASVASSFDLPEEVYSHMMGDWNVEVASPCQPTFSNGAVHIANASSRIFLQANPTDVQDLPLTQASFEEILGFHGLGPFLSTEGASGKPKFGYRVCRTQVNFLATKKRPVLGPYMATTQLTEISGVILSTTKQRSGADPCKGADTDKVLGEVVIRTVGAPMDGVASEKDIRQKEAIQYAEVSISTRGLPGTCAAVTAPDAGGAAAAERANKKTSRKRRGLRNAVGSSEVSSEEAEAAVASGFTVIRFSKKTPPTKSFLEKFYPSLLFAGLFLLYRVVYGFFSYRSSK